MRKIVGSLVAGIVMAAVGSAFVLLSQLDNDIVRAENGVVSEHYDAAQAAYDRAVRYYDIAGRLPWVGDSAAKAVRAREAELRYWQRQYTANQGDTGDPVANVPADNIGLQFVVANSVYRDSVSRAKDRQTTLAALDAGINAYTTVLKNAGRHDDASYNYELLQRLRDEIDQGRRKVLPPAETAVHGRPGSQPTAGDSSKFKVYVPLEEQEIDKNNKAATAAKSAPIKRKG